MRCSGLTPLCSQLLRQIRLVVLCGGYSSPAAEDCWFVYLYSQSTVPHITATTCWVKTVCKILRFSLVAGQYTCKEGKNGPCLVYVSFNHKIYIYWKVELERMESTNLLRVLEEKPGFKSHLKMLGVGKYVGSSAFGVKHTPPQFEGE